MRNLTLRILSGAFALLLLSGSTCGDELWVSNQPFQGLVSGSGQKMMVELEAFVQALNIEVDDQGDTVVVGGFPIPVQASGSVRFVPLRDVVDAAGLQISRNPELGTVDVRQASAGTGSRGDWNDPSNGSDSRSSAHTTKLEGDVFRVNVPSHLRVVSEPRFFPGEETDNAKKRELNSNPFDRNQTAFVVTTEAGPERGVLTVNLLKGLPGDLRPEEEPVFFEAIRSDVLSGGGQALGPVRVAIVAGKRFHQFKFRNTEDDGISYDSEISIHFNPKAQVALLTLLKAPQDQFHRVAPHLRLVIRNLRIK